MTGKTHEQLRAEVWLTAWANVSGAFNLKHPSDATRWADAALEAFDQRFKNPDQPKPYTQTQIGYKK